MNPNEKQPTSSQTEATFPHSGSMDPALGGEKPVRIFDNTTLSSAVDSGLIRTPDTAAELHPDRKSRKKLLIGLGSGAAGLAIFAGAALGLKNNNDTGNAPQPTATATEQIINPETPASQNPVENSAEREKLIKSLEIPANLSTQQLAETYIQRVNTWNNFGSKPNIGDIYIKQNEDEFNKTGVDNLQPIDFARTYMEGYSDEFAEALYVDHNNKDIKTSTDVSGGVLYYYMSTVNNQTNGAQEGYKTTATLDSATEDTANKVEGQRTLVIDLTQSDNSDKMGSIKLNATGSGKWEETVVFKTVDGTDKIVSVDSRFIG